MVELPTQAAEVRRIDIDGNIAVWWEGTYDEASDSCTDQHIYSYVVPDGPKVGVAGGARIEAPIAGDATWAYGLGKTYLAWEEAAALGALETGAYVLGLTAVPAEPRLTGADAWRPSVFLGALIYWENGLQFVDLATGEKREIDPRGDFPTTAASLVAYFRGILAASNERHGGRDQGHELDVRL